MLGNGTLYYAQYSKFVAFKGASIDCVIDVESSGKFSLNFSILTPYYIFGTTCDESLSHGQFSLWNPSNPLFPKFINKQIFYYDEYNKSVKNEVEVPLARKKKTETFDNFFDSTPIHSDVLTAIDESHLKFTI